MKSELIDVFNKKSGGGVDNSAAANESQPVAGTSTGTYAPFDSSSPNSNLSAWDKVLPGQKFDVIVRIFHSLPLIHMKKNSNRTFKIDFRKIMHDTTWNIKLSCVIQYVRLFKCTTQTIR